MGVVSTQVGPVNRLFGRAGGWSLASLGSVLVLDSRNAGSLSAPNLGSGGSSYDARYGSAVGADTNDPVLLTHTGTNYLYLPGSGSNYASTPDAAALDITGDIEIVVRVALADYTPTANQVLCSKRATGQYSWQFYVGNGAGPLTLVVTTDGTTQLQSQSVNPSAGTFVDGTTYWLKVARVASTGVCAWYYAADQTSEPTSWTTLAANTNGAGGNIFSGTTELAVGGISGGNMDGRLYRCIVRNGIGGTTVFDADFTTGITSGAQTTFTESSANAATVTINRSTSGRKAVAVVRPVWLFGTDDYMEVSADPEGAYLQTSGVAGQYASSPYVSADTGTATSGTTTTLTDTTKAWTASLFVNRQVRITGGTGSGQTGIITANTATQLTIGVAWAVAPDATSTYVVESAFQVTGDLEIVCRVNLTDWTPATENLLVARYNTTGNHRCYGLRISTGGTPYLAWSADGTTVLTAVPAGGPAFVDGTTYWLKATLDVDNGAAGRTARYYYAADSATEPTSWTQWGTDVTAAGVTSLYASSSAALEVASFNNGSAGMLTGNAYRAIVRRGIGGTTVADWAAYGHPANAGTFGDANQNVWTINGGTLRNANRLNFGATDSFTVVAVVRQWATPINYGRYVDKKLGGGIVGGYSLSANVTSVQFGAFLGDGSTGPSAVQSFTAGQATVGAEVINRTAQTLTMYANTTPSATTSISTLGSMATALPLRIGTTANVLGGYQEFELLAVAVIPKALTAAEITQINNYYGTA